MKIEIQEAEFRAVTIILETQKEIDALYAILNYKPIGMATHGLFQPLHNALWGRKGFGCKAIQSAIDKAIKGS